MSFLVFDIETRIDKELVRAIELGAHDLSEEEAFQRHRAALESRDGGGFFPLTYHIPICIVAGYVGEDYVLDRVETWTSAALGEADLVRQFWAALEAFDGTLVSFNGRGFDLPVLELQALRWGCRAPKYFNQRDGMRARYGRHYDLYDFLSNGGAARLRGGLDLVTRLIGLAGKVGPAGADVQALWEAERHGDIAAYCRRDVIQTYLLFLRVEHMRDRLTAAQLGAIETATAPFRAELTSPAR